MLSQALSDEIRTRIQASTPESPASFRLTRLQVFVCKSDDVSNRCRVPLWDGLNLFHRQNALIAGRIIEASVDLKLGG